MSQAELAEDVGATQGAISQILTGATRNSRLMPKIAQELAVNLNWLIGATDEKIDMLDVHENPVSEDLLAAIKAGRAENILVNPGQLSQASEVPSKAEADADHVEIDMIDFAYGMGGTFTDTDHIDVEKVGFSRRWLRQFTHSAPNQLFTTKGIGDSMAPTISDHDIVVVDKSDRVPEFADKVWAIVYGGMAMIKRLRQLPDGSMLISSDNQLVRDARATDGELHVVGRVVAVVRKL